MYLSHILDYTNSVGTDGPACESHNPSTLPLRTQKHWEKRYGYFGLEKQ